MRLWGPTGAHQLPPCMFACGGSSPMAPALAVKQTKQTSLDSYSRPSTRLAMKEVKARRTREAASRPKTRQGMGPDEVGPIEAKAKEKGKQKVTEPRGAPGAPVSDGSEDGESNCSQAACSGAEGNNLATGKGPKHAIRSPEEGRLYLEEEAFIDPGELIDLDVMVGALVQVLLMADILAPVGLTVRVVALILAQMKTEPPKDNNSAGATLSSSADAVTTKLEAHMKAMQEEAASVAIKM